MGQFENGRRVTIASNGNFRPVANNGEPYIGTAKEVSNGQMTVETLQGMSDVVGGPMTVTRSSYDEHDLTLPVRADVAGAYAQRPTELAKALARGYVGRPVVSLRAFDVILGPLEDRTKTPPRMVLAAGDFGTVLTASSLAPAKPSVIAVRVRRESDNLVVKLEINASAHMKVKIEAANEIATTDRTSERGVPLGVAILAANGDIKAGDPVVLDADGRVRSAT
jgi:hypothetical protein